MEEFLEEAKMAYQETKEARFKSYKPPLKMCNLVEIFCFEKLTYVKIFIGMKFYQLISGT
jgi:hypothetical protein